MPQPWEEGIYRTVWSWDPALLLQCRLALQTISLPPAELSVLQGTAGLSLSTQGIQFVTVRAGV